jgi:hypothetical protein
MGARRPIEVLRMEALRMATIRGSSAASSHCEGLAIGFPEILVKIKS